MSMAESNLYLADWQGGRFKFEGKGVPVSRIFKSSLRLQSSQAPNLKSADEATLIKCLSTKSSSIRLQAQQYLLQKTISKSGNSTVIKNCL